MVENMETQLTKEDIQLWCASNTIYQRGVTYFRQGRVFELVYMSDTNEWEASVRGSEDYYVFVELGEDWLSAECDCPAFESYHSCKHIVAVMLEIEKRLGEQWPGKQAAPAASAKYRMADEMIQSFMNQPDRVEERTISRNSQPLKVEYICKVFAPMSAFGGQVYLTVECKVGVERTYVIKDLRQFLQKVGTQSSYYFTKKFTYDPNEQVFLDEDWAVIDFLLGMIDDEYFRTLLSNSYYSSRKDERSITIPPIFVDEFLKRMSECKVTVDIDSESYHGFSLREGLLPLTFPLAKSSWGDFLISMDALKQGTYFESYGYFFLKGTFYKLSPEQQRIVQNISGFIRHPASEGTLSVNHEQMESLVSHVLPNLKKVGEVKLADDVSDQIANPPLQAKIFLDREEERLTVNIEYHYDNIMIHPFGADEETRKMILMRDAEREQQLMDLFENAPMHYNGTDCTVDGEENLYDFLYTTVPALEDKADIFMTQAVRSLFLMEQQTPTTSIDVNSDGNLLEIAFDMDGIDPGEVQHILQSVVEKKRYYRLPDGAFVSLEDDGFQQVEQLLGELNIPAQEADSTIKVPVHRSLQIEGLMNHASHDSFKAGKMFRRLVQDLKNPDTVDFTLPDSLEATLRDYQQFGFQWLKTLAHYRLGGILADDMGLGKTLQSIAYLLSEKEKTASENPSLVVVPASVVYNWKNEFARFSPSLHVGVAYGLPQDRVKVIEDKRFDVLITSYSLLRSDMERYREHTFDTLILDEAQAIKNHTTKTAKAVKKINAAKRFALSGTPIENALEELRSIFDAIMPGFFGDAKAFKNLPQERISQMARPFILRRMKKDVLKELPDKIETVHQTELTKEQKELYLGYLGRIQKETKNSLEQEGFQKNRIKILAGLTRLRQLCCHPSLFLENYNGKSGKLEQLMEMVENALENGQRLLIFSQFSSMLQMIRARLQKENIDGFYLDGGTPSLERISMMERFNDGEKDIFLVSLKAGGTGLNLTGADTVILYDLWWNPAVEEQAAGRAHRIGQKNVVQVMRVIARGTIEEKIFDMQQKKKELIEQVVQPGETMLTAMSEDEIRDILGI